VSNAPESNEALLVLYICHSLKVGAIKDNFTEGATELHEASTLQAEREINGVFSPFRGVDFRINISMRILYLILVGLPVHLKEDILKPS